MYAISAVLGVAVFQFYLQSWSTGLCSWETDKFWVLKGLVLSHRNKNLFTAHEVRFAEHCHY